MGQKDGVEFLNSTLKILKRIEMGFSVDWDLSSLRLINLHIV